MPCGVRPPAAAHSRYKEDEEISLSPGTQLCGETALKTTGYYGTWHYTPNTIIFHESHAEERTLPLNPGTSLVFLTDSHSHIISLFIISLQEIFSQHGTLLIGHAHTTIILQQHVVSASS